MHLRFNFDACPMHSPSGFVHLTHQNLSARALFCLNSLAKVNTQLLIYNSFCMIFIGLQLLTSFRTLNPFTFTLYIKQLCLFTKKIMFPTYPKKILPSYKKQKNHNFKMLHLCSVPMTKSFHCIKQVECTR